MPDRAPRPNASAAALEVFATGQAAYAQPRRFADMLDQWGEKILSLGPSGAGELNTHLQSLIETTAPLMEKGRAASWISEELAEKLEEETRPAAAFSAAGALLAANTRAAETFGLEFETRLADLALERADAQRVSDVLRAARDAMESETGAESPRPPVVAALSAEDGEAMLAELRIESAADDGAALVLVRGLDMAVNDASMAALAQAHELTEAETAIARLTARGFGAAEIATWRDTSVETVRTQLKSLREKTGARSQMEILRLVAGLAPLAEAAPRRPDYGMPRRHGLIQLSGGRRMEYMRVGPAGGRPILVLHAVLFGFRWPDALTARLVEAGFTLYFPVRPGYGLTSRTSGALDFDEEVRDLAEFADKMDFDTYEVVGQGVSAGVAAALAERHHNRVSAIASVAGYLPLNLDQFFEDMTAWQRVTLHVARNAPKLISLTSSLSARMMRKIGAEEFYAKTFSNSPSDTAVTRDPEALKLLSASLDLVRAQNLRGLNVDFPRVMEDWQARWSQMRTPYLQIHGDEKQVFAPGKAASACNRHPAVRFELVKGGGQMLAYSHPEAVADLLISHFHNR